MRLELKELRLKVPTTSIFVTHDQTEAMTLGDRIVVMKDGFVQQVGTPLELYRRPANRPQRVLKAHSSNQVAHFLRDARAASKRSGLPLPVSGKPPAMPAQHRLGPDDGYGIKDARVAPMEPDEQGAIHPPQMQPTTRRALLQDVQLMP